MALRLGPLLKKMGFRVHYTRTIGVQRESAVIDAEVVLALLLRQGNGFISAHSPTPFAFVPFSRPVLSRPRLQFLILCYISGMRTLLASLLCLMMGFLGGYYVGNGQISTEGTRRLSNTLDKAAVEAKEYMKSSEITTTREVDKPAENK